MEDFKTNKNYVSNKPSLQEQEEEYTALYRICTIIFIGCILIMIATGWALWVKGKSNNIIKLEKDGKYIPLPPHLKK